MSLPYRQHATGPCSRCSELADGVCLRCGCSLCGLHAHSAKQRCQTCEEEFAAVVMLRSHDETGSTFGEFGLIGAVVDWVDSWRQRRRFLRQRPGDLPQAPT